MLNFDALKAGFIDYLEKQNIINTDSEEYENINDISIFMYANEFKEYIEQETDIDISEISTTITDLMAMGFGVDNIEDSENTDNKDDVIPEENQGGENAPENNTGETQDKENILNDLFNELLNNEDFFNKLDENNDKEINLSEKEAFLKSISNFDDNKDDISLTDMLTAADYIKNNKFDELKNKDTGTNIGETQNVEEPVSGGSTGSPVSTSTGGTGGGGNYGNYNSNSSPTNKKEETKKPLDKMSKEELKTELAAAKNTLSDKKSELKSAQRGKGLETLNKQTEEAFNAYYEGVNEIEPELAENLKNIISELDEKKAKKDELQNSLNQQKNNIRDAKAQHEQIQNTVDALHENLLSLESVDKSNLSDEQIAELDEKISKTKRQYETAVDKEDTARQNLEDEETGLEKIQTDLENAQDDYKTTEQQKNTLESDIAEKHPEIKELQEKYNSLKTEYETKKDSNIESAQRDVADAIARVNEVQTALSNVEDKKNIKENLAFKSTPDLFDSDVEYSYEFINDGSTIPYLLIGPKDADPDEELPVLMYLHGSGEIGAYGDAMVNGSNTNLLPYNLLNNENGFENFNGYILCPVLGGNYGSNWQSQNAVNHISSLLDDFASKHSINEEKVAIAGHSLGGIGAEYIGYHLGSRFCSIGVLSGYGAGVDVSELGIPVYGFVGEADGGSVPYMTGTLANKIGAENVYVQSGVGHGDLPKSIYNTDSNGDGRSDFFELLFGDEDE